MKAIILLLSLAICPSFAQKIIEKKLDYKAGQEVNLNLKFADSIQVHYWDKPEVSVRIEVEINGGRLNDALLVRTGSTGQEIKLEIDLDGEMLRNGKAEDCPGARHSYNVAKDGSRSYVCSEIQYAVYLPRKAPLKLETINGNILIDGGNAPVFAKSISGYVDMNWPRSQGADLTLSSITGEVYTDLDITFKGKREKAPIVGYKVEGRSGDGGPHVRLETISNNIYLRSR